jgi:hypothetical protein
MSSIHLFLGTHTHTHTHTYIYIYNTSYILYIHTGCPMRKGQYSGR